MIPHRRNFFGSRVKYVVYVYPYTKKHARGGRNQMKAGSHADLAAAEGRARDKIAEGYPEVEIVAEHRGGRDEIVWSQRGGRYAEMAANPRRWNRSKKRKKSKRRTSTRGRDWVAVHAKGLTGRKGAGAHKDRSKYSRRKKHKGRSRNPAYTTPYGVDEAAFVAAVAKRRAKAMSEYRGILVGLTDAGAQDLPDAVELDELAAMRAVAMASAAYPDVPGQALASLTPAKMADRLLGLDGDSAHDEFAEYKNKYKASFAGSRERLIEQIKSERRRAAGKKGAASRRVKASTAPAPTPMPGADLRARKAALLAERAGLTVEAEPTEEDYELVDDEAVVDHDREIDTRRRKQAIDKLERLGDRADFRARTRRRDVKPPTAVLAEAQEDVLLFWLTDGSTQVWSKGSLTETFLPFKRKSSLKIAYEYAQSWRGLDERGKLKARAKKSRLRSRILTAVEGGGDEYEVVADAVREAQASREVTKKLDDVTLAKAKEILKINPRRLTNGSWERQRDGSYYLGGQGVSYLVKKERVRIGTRDVGMWALYRFSKKMDTGWRRQEQFRTLAEAKKRAAPLRGIGKRGTPLGLGYLGYNPRRRKNTRFEDHTKSPYHRVLLRRGMKYSHSVPVNHRGTKVPHHVYRLGSTDFYTSFYTRPASRQAVWEGSVSGSGRMHQGKGAQELDRYLKGAVKRHRTKAAN